MSTVEWDDAYCDVMARKFGISNMSNIEVLGIGSAVLNWAEAVHRLGHASPASTLDYTTTLNDLSALIVRDFVAWTCGRENTVPGDPRERLMALLEAADWQTVVAEKIGAKLSGATA